MSQLRQGSGLLDLIRGNFSSVPVLQDEINTRH